MNYMCEKCEEVVANREGAEAIDDKYLMKGKAKNKTNAKDNSDEEKVNEIIIDENDTEEQDIEFVKEITKLRKENLNVPKNKGKDNKSDYICK